MITQAIIDIFSTIVSAVASLLPGFDLPAWVPGAVSTITTGIGKVEGFGNWMPLGAFRDGVLFVGSCMVFVVGVRVVRIAVSLFTGGGGSAA